MGMYRTILNATIMIAMFALVLLVMDHYEFFDRQVPQSEEEKASNTAKSVVSTPPRTSSPYDEIVIYRNVDGHFWVDAYVNGDEVRFMIDTGASYVVLSPDDAERLGFDFWEEDYTMRVRTATGEFAMAPVMIDEIEIENEILIYNVRGAVLNGGSDVSLLGLSFLNRLSSYKFSGDELILTP